MLWSLLVYAGGKGLSADGPACQCIGNGRHVHMLERWQGTQGTA